MLRHAILFSTGELSLNAEDLLGALFTSNGDPIIIETIEDAQKILESIENTDYLYITVAGEVFDQAAEFLSLMPCQAKEIYVWENDSVMCYLCREWAIF